MPNQKGGGVVIQMIYQKKNGEIIERIRNTSAPYKIGDTTSMGWKVISIKYKRNGKYYDRIEYDRITNKIYNRHKKFSGFKYKISELYHNLSYIFILLILFRVYEAIGRI